MTGLAGDRESEEGRKAVRFGILDTAILDNDLDLIKALLPLGIEPWIAQLTVGTSVINMPVRQGRNLIQLAVDRGKLQALQILVAHTLSVLPRDQALHKILYPEEGLSLVLSAAASHKWGAPFCGSMLEYLLDLGANINDLSIEATPGSTLDWGLLGDVGDGLLHVAVSQTRDLPDPEVFRALARRGANLDLRARRPAGGAGCTALELALRIGNVPAAQELVRLGASFEDPPDLRTLPMVSRAFVKALRARRLLRLASTSRGATKSRRSAISF